MWLGLKSFISLTLLRLFNEQLDQAPANTNLPLTFELRHEHGISPTTNRIVFADVPAHLAKAYAVQHPNLAAKTRPTRVYRPNSQREFQAARIRSSKFGQTAKLGWNEDGVLGPDIKDRETLTLLAKMTNNAYLNPGDAEWYDLGGGWNAVRQLCVTLRVSQYSPEFDRTIRLDGNQTLTAFGGMSSPLLIIAPSSYPSRARLLASLEVVGRRQRRTSSTTTYYFHAVAPVST